MRLSTLLLTALLSTSIAAPADRNSAGAVAVRDEPNPLNTFATRAIYFFYKRADVTQTGPSEQAVKSGLITSLLPYISSGGTGVLGNVVDSLIELIRGLGLKKRNNNQGNKRKQTKRLTESQAAAVTLEALEKIKNALADGKSPIDAVYSVMGDGKKSDVKVDGKLDTSKEHEQQQEEPIMSRQEKPEQQQEEHEQEQEQEHQEQEQEHQEQEQEQDEVTRTLKFGKRERQNGIGSFI
ncbi:hypothetical protein B0T10DRAFT_592290 [Thelonectria olida]|uniref:Uncharacterized protein n=1 Tax=Thelonectria olida TaxID=1576542 RepID=A0A9P8W9K7_9HYPO|nr:hypothetical protein B0T10DRAFT_592290 [Thelonectria olida]